MKKSALILTLISLLIISCKKETQQPQVEIVNNSYVTHLYVHGPSGWVIYEVLEFVSNSQVDIYEARDGVQQVSDRVRYNYTYDYPDITISRDGENHAGTVSPSRIRIFNAIYSIQN